MGSIRLLILSALVSALLLPVFTRSAAAQGVITFTSAAANWQTPNDDIPVANPTITSGAPTTNATPTTSSISWGTATPVTRRAATTSPSRSRTLQMFPVATFTHRNFPVSDPSLTSVQLDFVLDFLVNGVQTGPLTFTFTFNHEETPNNQDPCPYPTPPGEGCTDRVTFIDAPDPTTFTVGGKTYTLAMTFLDEDGNPVTEFITEEGGAGNTADLDGQFTLVPPVLEVTKSGPATMNAVQPGVFAIDVENTGPNDAWNTSIRDVLPNVATGGMCDATPQVLSAQVFAADGVTPAPGKGPLLAGTDFALSYAGAPTCELAFTMLTPAAVIGPDERLIITYQTQLDAGQPGRRHAHQPRRAPREWFDDEEQQPGPGHLHPHAHERHAGHAGPRGCAHRHGRDRGLPVREDGDGRDHGRGPGHDGCARRPAALPPAVREPGRHCAHGLWIYDVPDRLSSAPGCSNGTCFQPGTLQLITVPPGADASNTSATGGPKGTGVVDVRNISVAAGATVLVEFVIRLDSAIANGTLVANQSALRENGTPLSDDPNVNGPSDPFDPNDQDPTVVQIASGPLLRVQKISTDLSGDPNVLNPGDTLRYTITVKNVGGEDVTDASFRDSVPANTQYVAGSTTLNGVAVADGPGGSSPLATGIPIYAPGDPTPGVLRADPVPGANNVATIVFDVTIDAGVVDGTVISNQAFVAATRVVPEQPSDDPNTATPDDPTRDVVGSVPLLFAPKAAALLLDGGSFGIVDPLDTLHYTITIYNNGAVPATGVVLTDSVPANTTYVANSTTVNGSPVPDGPSGFPLATGLALPDIALGANVVVGFNLQVNAGVASGTQIVNQATVTTNETPNVLTDGDGNPATGPEPTIVVVGDQQALTITKQVVVVGGGVVLGNSTLEYLVRVTNVASVPANGVVITDDVATSGWLTLVPGSATLNGSTVGVTEAGTLITADYSTSYGPLAPGASVELRFRAVINNAPNGTIVTNTGTVTWNTNQTASASVSVQVGLVPGIGVLSGTAWHDFDFNDVFDPGMQLVGWSVELLRNNVVIASVLTDGNGDYQIGGVPPNDVNGDQYVLRFRSPGAGLNTAALGVTSSPFTNGPQQISNILVPTSGANIGDLNLPIDPNGVVYGALSRTEVAGATVTMLSASGTVLSGSCFLDPVQQNQVTTGSGFYKFDLTFGDLSCPSGGAYLIAVTPPGSGFGTGISTLIPPTSDQTTPPFSVPGCPNGPADTVQPLPAGFCEAQPLPTPPQPPAATTYYLHFTLDNSGGAGSAELFNNHIPLDPILADLVTITKTTPSLNVSRGQLVPYEITVNNALGDPLPDLAILDRFPRGFHYVEGSARIEGVPVEPVTTGFEMVWLVPDGLPGLTKKTLVMLLAVGAGVSEGEFTNRAQAISGAIPGVAYSGEAFATVRVVPDPTFDCTDVIGKVFDDANRDGEQGQGEKGLANVRLVTARGLAATTDPHGRFHITCAVVPREGRGSNFVLKLDDRTLPTGYRMTTRQVQVQRATRGKVLPYHFGAAIGRVVELDVADAVFEPNTTTMREQWKPRIALLIEELAKSESILRLSYVADVEDAALVEARVAAVKQTIAEAWAAQGREPLNVETEVFWRRGGPPAGNGSPAGVLESMLPSVDAGPPMFETTPGNAVERQMSADTPFSTWSQDPQRVHDEIGDKLEKREVTSEQAKIVKLKNVVPAIHFDSGVANIPPSTIAKLRSVLDSMQDLPNVRLHLVGHADNEPLSPALTGVFGDNQGLSHERAGEVAEFIQTALALPPEAISFDWAGDTQPIASNATESGRAQNRRVEVEVWYDQMEEKSSLEDVVVHEDIKRVKVCRTETVCKLSYQEGHARRARVKNLIPPLHAGEENVQISDEFVQQIQQALHDLRDKQHVTVKFIGYTDDAPLAGRAERIYGTHLALSKALSHRAALATRDALKLPTSAIASDGRGASRPIASNETDRGRALNRRVEVEFWYDDPLADLPQEPQICPDGAGADLVTVVYDPPWGPIAPLQLDAHGEAQVPTGYGDALRRALGEVADRDPPAAALHRLHAQRADRAPHRARLRRRRRSLDRARAPGDGEDQGRALARAGAGRARGPRLRPVRRRGERGLRPGRNLVRGSAGRLRRSRAARRLRGRPGHAAHARARGEGAARAQPDAHHRRRQADRRSGPQPGRHPALHRRRARRRGDPVPLRQPEGGAAPVGDRGPDLGAGVGGRRGGDRPASKAYTNYPHWIERSEVRIFERGQSVQAEPLAWSRSTSRATPAGSRRRTGSRRPCASSPYVLRAYDAQGQFDETQPQSLWLKYAASSPDRDRALPQAGQNGDPLLANYGETGPSTRNIPLGNAGTRPGARDAACRANHSVFVAGAAVPVDAHGNFVGEVVLPEGMHTVEVAVLDEQGNGELFLRDLELKKSDWFYVGIADVTVQADLEGQPVRGALAGR